MAPIPSPCVKLCLLDDVSGLCQGCGRSLDEIARWSSLTEEQRLAIMADLRGRVFGAGDRPDALPPRRSH